LSLHKFIGDQGDHYPGRMSWSSTLGGVPFLGPPPNVKQRETDAGIAKHHLDFRWRMFDLSNPKDGVEYRETMDRIVNGLFTHHVIDRHVDHGTGKVTVYIEWSVRYATVSPESEVARSSHAPLSTPSLLAGQQPSDRGPV
jgi:hypothetical protein